MPTAETPPRVAFETTIVIDRPIEDLWGLMTDWSQAAEWWPRATDVEGPSPAEAGDTVTFIYQGNPASAFIDAADEPHRLVLRRVNGPVSATFDYHLDPEGASTVVHLRATLATERALRVVAPLLRRALARTDKSQLDLLRRLADPTPEHSAG